MRRSGGVAARRTPVRSCLTVARRAWCWRPPRRMAVGPRRDATTRIATASRTTIVQSLYRQAFPASPFRCFVELAKIFSYPPAPVNPTDSCSSPLVSSRLILASSRLTTYHAVCGTTCHHHDTPRPHIVSPRHATSTSHLVSSHHDASTVPYVGGGGDQNKRPPM